MNQVALFLTIKTQPGKREDLRKLWDQHLRGRAESNSDQTHYVFAYDLADENTVRISEVYASQEAFEANSQAPWFAEYMKEAGPLLAGQPEFHMASPQFIK